MKTLKKYSMALAVSAMVTMPIAPVTAAEFNPNPSSQSLAFEQGEALWLEDNQDRRRRFRRHRRGVRGGDILVGAAILGGIAILAGSANRNRRARQEIPQNFPQNNPQNFPQNGQQNFPQNNSQGNDIGNAINICSDAALQSAGNEYNINQIRSVTRDGQGWRVDGDLNGPEAASFACGVSAGDVQFIQIN